MASSYVRGGVIWIAFRDANGKRRNRSTGYKQSNGGDRQQAKRLLNEANRQERLTRIARSENFDWVDSWLDARWGNSDDKTPKQYRFYWRTLRRWLTETRLKGPANIRREHCLSYPKWREAHNGSRNTAILELKFLGQVLQEAVNRDYIDRNPARGLGLKRESSKEKRAWTDEEMAKVDAELLRRDKFGWLRVTFLLGRFQACRMGQCAVPLHDIDLERREIYYAKPKGGTGKAYTQRIDKRLLGDLRAIVEHRKSIGAETLCDLPLLPSVEWRLFLDSIGVKGVSHHDLRRTWITKAALAGIPESVAQKFSNHSSTAVHRIYMRFSSDDMAAMLEKLG